MVNIKEKVYNKIFGYAEYSRHEEIGGLLLGKIQSDGQCLITKAIILKQKRTDLGFEIDDDDMMEFTKSASDKTLKSVIGWWHSHGYSDTRWSLDDDRTFKRLSDFLNGFCVGIVVSIADNKNSRFRIDMKHKSGDTYTIDNILPNIIEKKKIGGIINSVLSGIDIREIKAKVVSSRDAEVTWDTCSLCKGSGVVFRKRIELENEAGVELNSTGDIYG